MATNNCGRDGENEGEYDTRRAHVILEENETHKVASVDSDSCEDMQ